MGCESLFIAQSQLPAIALLNDAKQLNHLSKPLPEYGSARKQYRDLRTKLPDAIRLPRIPVERLKSQPKTDILLLFSKESDRLYISHRPTNLRNRRPHLFFYNLPAVPTLESGISYGLVTISGLNQPIQVGLAPAGDAAIIQQTESFPSTPDRRATAPMQAIFEQVRAKAATYRTLF